MKPIQKLILKTLGELTKNRPAKLLRIFTCACEKNDCVKLIDVVRVLKTGIKKGYVCAARDGQYSLVEMPKEKCKMSISKRSLTPMKRKKSRCLKKKSSRCLKKKVSLCLKKKSSSCLKKKRCVKKRSSGCLKKKSRCLKKKSSGCLKKKRSRCVKKKASSCSVN